MTPEKAFKTLDHLFDKLQVEVIDLTDAYNEFIPEFQKSRYGWIMAGRSVEGQKFVALSKPYKKEKKKKWKNQPILVASGKLLGAIQGGPGWSHKVSATKLEIEIDIPYAEFLQYGTSKMPQRNFFLTKEGGLTKLDLAQLIQAIEGHIEETTKTILGEDIK